MPHQANSQPLPERTKEINCIAKAMYFEAFQGTVDSKKAISWVLRNRLFHGYFPLSYCENIYLRGQFPWTNASVRNSKEWMLSLELADYMYQLGFYQEEDPTEGATFFASKEDGWFNHMISTSQFEQKAFIGGHRYYFWKSHKNNEIR
jgi:spore germination cell wall hydrolase CwlJ-like protein